MAFGYRIFQFGLGKPYKPDVRYSFDNVALHSDGARGVFRDALKAMIAVGDADSRRNQYFSVDSVHEGGWLFRIASNGGQYGRIRRVKDVSNNSERDPIGADHAVVDDLPLLLVVPSYGNQGLLIAATQGRSHNAFALQRTVEIKIRDKGLDMPLASDLADATAWNGYLGKTNLDVTHVELIQTEVDSSRPTFGKKGKISRARVLLTISDQQTKKSVLQRVKAKVLNNQPLGLTGVFGMQGLNDTDFDDYRIIYVQDGRERSLAVSTDFPHFIYPIDGNVAPTPDELLTKAKPDIEHLMTEMGINFPSDWDTGAGVTALQP